MPRLAPIVVAASIALAAPVHAQNAAPVGVLADRMYVDATTGDLRAEGDVTITQGTTTLQTDVLVYNSTDGTLSIPGPLRLIDGADDTVLVADFAELDASLQAGVISGARSLIDGELQLAAGTAQRVGERYTVLNRVVASSCSICDTGETPIWQLRATRAVRDAEEQRLHYENVKLDVFGVPVLYLPYFSHPDAGVERTTGLLTPLFTSSSVYGTGVKLPYFVALAPDRDTTITPFLTTGDGILFEAQYRQAFTQGYLELNGSVRPSDDLSDWRGFSTARGNWTFANRVRASFAFTQISDDRFLADYGYSSPDRIESNFGLSYYEEDHFWEAETVYFQTLRATEAQSTVPYILPDADYRRRFTMGDMQAELSGSILSYSRQNGRDVTRVTVGGQVDRTYITGPGLVLRAFAEANADYYVTQDDPVFGSDDQARLRSLAGIELRYPFILRGEGSHIIEPIVQLVRGDDTADLSRIANEDSSLVEFDETSLFSTNRFAGADRFESGTYANVGLRYESRTRTGMLLSGTLGRVFRSDSNSGFAANTPLGGEDSDYVVSFGVDTPSGLSVSGSVLASDEFNIEQTELDVGYTHGDLNVDVTYAQLERTATDPARAQLIAAAGYNFDENWRGEIDFRRDMEVDEFVSASGRLRWENECIRVGFSVSRNFAQSANITGETSFGLNIELVGVGSGRAAERHRERCAETPGS
ncbi:LPS-assembly protein LptD [Pontivivens insulae]|uniref:LPS-assembly protein LptD n=1 Tax=Pontivivens insulae TaxID=1639689 RepID=A0A2R8AAZ4_9RHOB|nr:LPS assembly protein LptD [Pontivivens insulae]RED13301.1 LPS-assembly protein [Pontivivens insulae]SPF29393.1 LPS-assembly protein LptD [Pontivivens insulae]